MTALQMTPDEALALAEEKTRGETIHPMSTSLFAIMLVLAEEVRRLREREAGLLEQHHRDSAELRRVCAERDDARADERTAMGYLAQVRQVVGGADFPDMVRRVERLRADAKRLDTLEREAREPGGIRLHAEAFVESRAPCQRGLGLQHRTLREAVDQFMGEATNAG